MTTTERLRQLLFPDRSRGFPGKRWVNISLRTLHLVGTAGLGGAFLYGAPVEAWLPYLWLTLSSGFLMAGLECWSNGVWLIQLRGLAVLLKLLLLLAIAVTGGMDLPLFLLVILVSGVIAHAPGSVRYYSPYHGRRLESLGDASGDRVPPP